jgi:hypothetical protein
MFCLTNTVLAQVDGDAVEVHPVMKMKFDDPGSSLARVHSSAAGDPDTTYIGHIGTAGARPAPYHGVAGGYGPFHIGSGPARFNGTVAGSDGAWTWDNFQAGENDSLQGWWPYRHNYPFTEIPSWPDDQRPWWCLDFGNVVNYVINQGLPNRRGFGVTGMWHRDPGSTVPGPGTVGVSWSPSGSASSVGTSGSFSAWCGVRTHGDLTVIDAATGNYYNEDVCIGIGRTPATFPPGTTTTAKLFPGYNAQLDQELYRDVFVPAGGNLTVSFRYRTRMSTSQSTSPTAITGWYDKDPLNKVAGNFISASATANFSAPPVGCGASCAPLDSFMVYVGAPAEDGQGKYSNSSSITNIFDKQRRWHSEVLRVNESPTVPYYEMLSTFGNNPANNTDPTPSYSATITAANLTAIRGASGNNNKVRVVFRIKTNRAFDDGIANAYNSEGRGAAVIDEVLLTGGFKDAGFTQAWAAADGNFEAAGSVDNAVATPATDAWKSTGKPPAIYFHSEQLNNLTYADLCGDPGDPRRRCNMIGHVVKDGNEDDNDAGSGPFDADPQPEMEWNHGIFSPTINLMSNGNGDYNAMGIDAELAQVDGDMNIRLDEYWGRGDLFTYGGGIQYGIQSYPATNGRGVKVWGEPRFTGSIFFNPDAVCFISQGNDRAGFYQQGLVRTSNASGIPDSVRIILNRVSLCLAFGVTTDCNASDSYYMDNLSLELIDAPQPTISVDIWQWLNDCFPFNETANLTQSANFDTTTALVRTGLNIAAPTNNLLAPNVPGDSVAIQAFGVNRRVDMVFRILPGPGNYVIKGNKLSGLRQVPTSATAAVANAASTNFWEAYLGSNGTFGTSGGHPGGAWDQNVWNSARIDTAEQNIFPNISRAIFAVDQSGGLWQSTYHESDPKFGTLGILKNRCFLGDTAGATVDPNIDCDAAGGTYPPPWATTVPQTRTGYNGVTQTREYTKIIPDGQLTPGSSVQYFFRASTNGDLVNFDMCPDTTIVFPQDTESNSDGHRWQQFGVLPDNWKLVQPTGDGVGRACMLYVDNNDRRGNERMWISVADSIGMIDAGRRGAHNGWKAGYFDQYVQVANGLFQPVNVALNNTIAVRDNKGQAGRVFDMYQVKASESLDTSAGGFGSRLSNRTAIGLLTNKWSTHGPTQEMLRAFYRFVLVQTGDLNTGVWGPFNNRSDNDWGLVNDFTTVASPGTAQPRGVFVQGSGFVEDAFNNSDFNAEAQMIAIFNVDLQDRSYTNVSGVTQEYVDLLTTAAMNPASTIYGVSNICTETNDVIDPLTSTVTSRYQGNTFTSGAKNSTATKITMVDGFNAGALGVRFGGPGSGALTVGGRNDYMLKAISNVFGALCPAWTPTPVSVGDAPIAGGGSKFVNFLSLKSQNPAPTGHAIIAFGLAKAEPVEVKVYDVGGRLVKTLANRVFTAGEEHRLVWDGTNDAGQTVARGVYFYQLRTPTFASQKKLTVLKD